MVEDAAVVVTFYLKEKVRTTVIQAIIRVAYPPEKENCSHCGKLLPVDKLELDLVRKEWSCPKCTDALYSEAINCAHVPLEQMS